MIRGVLLVPPEGDPNGLLKGGAGGSSPPVATLCRHCEQVWSLGMVCEAEVCVGHYTDHVIGSYCLPPPKDALILGWDEKVVDLGCTVVAGPKVVDLVWMVAREVWDEVREFLADKGRLILIDENGHEVTHG